MSVRLFTNTFNGKPIAYSSETLFLVQVGRYRKGSYKTSYSFKGDLGKAVFYFNCLNIGNGYKKRLYVPSFNKPVLCKQASEYV